MSRSASSVRPAQLSNTAVFISTRARALGMSTDSKRTAAFPYRESAASRASGPREPSVFATSTSA